AVQPPATRLAQEARPPILDGSVHANRPGQPAPRHHPEARRGSDPGHGRAPPRKPRWPIADPAGAVAGAVSVLESRRPPAPPSRRERLAVLRARPRDLPLR